MCKLKIEVLDEITVDTFRDILHNTEDLPNGAEIELLISSYGGEILPTISIIETLKRFKTTANIIGYACSSAAILALSCNHVIMSELSSMLLHSVWNINKDNDDPGIKHCNAVQLEIIKKRCPDFNAKLIMKDTWLSAKQCLDLHLIDNIYCLDTVEYAALCHKYVAKLLTFKSMRNTMDEQKVNEVVEEVKDVDVDKDVDKEQHDLLEVIEKLTEELNTLHSGITALEERIAALEEADTEEKPVDVEEDPEQVRINTLYKSLSNMTPQNVVAPQAKIAIGADTGVKKSVQKVDYKAYASFIKS